MHLQKQSHVLPAHANSAFPCFAVLVIIIELLIGCKVSVMPFPLPPCLRGRRPLVFFEN